MAGIRWTEEAVSWLKDIYDYIAKDDQTAASNVINAIYDKAQILTDYPKIGYKYQTETEGEIRILLYGHYQMSITYLVKSQENIDILGVFLRVSGYI